MLDLNSCKIANSSTTIFCCPVTTVREELVACRQRELLAIRAIENLREVCSIILLILSTMIVTTQHNTQENAKLHADVLAERISE